MVKTGEDTEGLLDASSETELLNVPADSLSGSDLALLYDRRAEIEEELLYEDNDNYPFLLRTPTFAQREAIKEKLTQEDQRQKGKAEEDRRRQGALSLERYQGAMDNIIRQEKDLLPKTADMQRQEIGRAHV